MSAAVVFASSFAALYVAHSVGDHWVQTSCQAARKGGEGIGTGAYALDQSWHHLWLWVAALIIAGGAA